VGRRLLRFRVHAVMMIHEVFDEPFGAFQYVHRAQARRLSSSVH